VFRSFSSWMGQMSFSVIFKRTQQKYHFFYSDNGNVSNIPSYTVCFPTSIYITNTYICTIRFSIYIQTPILSSGKTLTTKRNTILLIFQFTQPKLLKGSQTSQNAGTNPTRELTFDRFGSDDFTFVSKWTNRRHFGRQALF